LKHHQLYLPRSKQKKKRAAEEISASSHETGRNGRERKWS
jgi:hypothetical protein